MEGEGASRGVPRLGRLRQATGPFELCLFALILAAAASFGLGIGSSAFWFDELVSVSVAAQSVGGIADTLHHQDLNMGLYYLLVHAWMWVGDSEAWVRSLSALSAIATVPVTAVLARRLFGDAVGLLSGLLLLGNMLVVLNAQNARSYALGLLLVTVATLLFVELVGRPRPALFVAYGAVSILAVYMTPLAGLIVLAHSASLPFLPDARLRARSFVRTYGAVALAVAPLAALMFVVGAGQVDYLQPPGPSALGVAASALIGAGQIGSLRVAYGVLAAVGLVAVWRGWLDRGDRPEFYRWRRALLVAWLLLPTALLFAFSQALPLFLSRYLIGCAPAAAITMAVGLVALARRSRPLSAAVAVIVLGLALEARIELRPVGGGTQRFSEGAARLIASEGRPGDGIVYSAPNTRLFDYYLSREAGPHAHLPSDFAIPAPDRGQRASYAKELPPSIQARRLLEYRRVWLVEWNWSGADPDTVPTLNILRSRYRQVSRRDFGSAFARGAGTWISLYERRGAAPR